MAKDQSNSGQHEALADEGDNHEALRKSLVRLKRKVEEQRERIEALAQGREKSLSVISELRAELALVTNERDELRRHLTAIETMQTETRTFDDDTGVDKRTDSAMMSNIDALISTISGDGQAPLSGVSHSTARVDSQGGDADEEWQELLSPEKILLGSTRERVGGTAQKYLVQLGEEEQNRWPIDQDLMTIGRSDSADIQIDRDFVSRIHARILRIGAETIIEDSGSRNGLSVNSDRIDRRALRHGDVVRIGDACFRFVDTAEADQP